MSSDHDDIYKKPLEQVTGFRFDAPVVNVFKDMIQRSVPGYNLVLSLLGVISAQYAQDDTYCYDLGCSLGASTLAMRHHINARNCTLTGLDNSAAMIKRCQDNIQEDDQHPASNSGNRSSVNIELADITNYDFQAASIFVLNFTLQFIALEQRLSLLKRIANSTVSGGVLLLSEKIHFDDTQEEEHISKLHHQFKALNGYSQLEIAQKREALDNVLIPETIATHKQRLLDAGFTQVYCCLQCFNFASLIAIK